MKFIIGEGGFNWLERISYRGAIGIFYNSTWAGLLTYIIFAAVCILAIIGLIAVIKTIGKKKTSKDPYKEWIKTGKM